MYCFFVRRLFFVQIEVFFIFIQNILFDEHKLTSVIIVYLLINLFYSLSVETVQYSVVEMISLSRPYQHHFILMEKNISFICFHFDFLFLAIYTHAFIYLYIQMKIKYNLLVHFRFSKT